MDALLTFTAVLPPHVDRRLDVSADGAARLRSPWPSPGAPAGDFELTLDAADLDTARRLAAALVVLPPPAPPSTVPPRTVIDATVVASSGGLSRTHRYGYLPQDEMPPDLLAAHGFANALTERCLQHPAGAVSLTASVQPPLPDRGPLGALRFVFTNPGTGPVTFTVDPASLRAAVDGADWTLGGRRTLGMVGPTGKLVDGVITPATLGPGASGTMAFPAALPAGKGVVRAEAAGTIQIRGVDPVRFAVSSG